MAFAWDGERQDNIDIYVKLIGPGRPLPLTTHPAKDFSPAWSPDGRLIAFLRELPAGKAGVFLIPALGGPELKLVETYLHLSSRYQPSLSNVAWSPDSQWLIIPVRRSPGEPLVLWLLSIETGEKRKLTSPPARLLGDSAPALSWDGRWTGFRSDACFGCQRPVSASSFRRPCPARGTKEAKL